MNLNPPEIFCIFIFFIIFFITSLSWIIHASSGRLGRVLQQQSHCPLIDSYYNELRNLNKSSVQNVVLRLSK